MKSILSYYSHSTGHRPFLTLPETIAFCFLMAGAFALNAEEIYVGTANPQGDPSIVVRVPIHEAFRVAVTRHPERATELDSAARAAAASPSVVAIMQKLKPLDAEIRRLIQQADELREQADIAMEREMAANHADAYALLSETRCILEKEHGQTDANAKMLAAERAMLLKGSPAISESSASADLQPTESTNNASDTTGD